MVAHLGVGPVAAAREARSLLSGAGKPRLLISTGFAGGLDPQLRVGDLVVARNFSSPDVCARAEALAGSMSLRLTFGTLVTRDTAIESTADKLALARETGALAVDMETAAVHEACVSAGVPMLALRAISDEATTPLPVPFDDWFDLERQRPRPWSLVKYLARHPQKILPFCRFVRGLAPARRAMADFLMGFLQPPP